MDNETKATDVKSSETRVKKKKQKSICFKRNRKGRPVNGVLTFLRTCIAPLVRIFMPYKVYGNKKSPDGAVLFIGNHFRAIDPMYSLVSTKEAIHYMSKGSLFKVPLVGAICRGAKVIGLNRDGTDIRAVMDAIKCLRNGDKLSIYPEGTRNRTKEPFQEFKGGAAMIAIKAKVPVLPIVIYNKQRLFRQAHVLMGEPFELSEYYGVKLTEEVLKEADNKLRDKFYEMRNAHTAYLESLKSKGKNK